MIRSGERLKEPNLELSRNSAILVATEKNSPSNSFAGLVEICLENPDGRLAPPFSIKFPWSSTIVDPSREPYLANLCIAHQYRRQGLGRLMCQLCEDVAVRQWRKERMYLHVEQSNAAAQKLYEGMGYEITQGLNAVQAKLQGMENILYYSKKLVSSSINNHLDSSEATECSTDAKMDAQAAEALGMTPKDMRAASTLLRGDLTSPASS